MINEMFNVCSWNSKREELPWGSDKGEIKMLIKKIKQWNNDALPVRDSGCDTPYRIASSSATRVKLSGVLYEQQHLVGAVGRESLVH